MMGQTFRISRVFRRFLDYSFRTKLMIAFLFLSFATVGTISFFTSRLTTTALSHKVGMDLYNLAHAQAVTLGAMLTQQIELLQTLSVNQILLSRVAQANTEFDGFSEAERDTRLPGQEEKWLAAGNSSLLVQRVVKNIAGDELRAFMKRFPDHSEILVTNRYGGVVTATSRPQHYWHAGSFWWRAIAQESQQVVIGLSKDERAAVRLEIAVPLLDPKTQTVIGALHSSYSCAPLAALLRLVEQQEQALSLKLLVAPDAFLQSDGCSLADVPPEMTAIFQQFAQRSAPLYIAHKFFGQAHLISSAPVTVFAPTSPINALGWSIFALQQRQIALSVVAEQQWMIVRLAILIIVGTIVTAILMANVLANPIQRLTLIVNQVRQGDLTAQASIEARDETGILAEAFNHMTIRLRQTLEELKALNLTLEQRVKERTAEIARQTYILDTFMANVPDSIYFKDRDGRFTRINRALARLFGVTAPTDIIGKTDFDFFAEQEARPKYDQEQAIMRTGQPMLAIEEPDAAGRWALTTKMPLRDEHGAIIGIFGISRDITPLKQAQKEITAAYEEIRLLNAQLEAENLRMGAELNVVRRLQQMVLPSAAELTKIDGVDIVGYMRPADEVGGDYYDVLSQNGTCYVGIGDVTGHGLESGVLMLMTQAAVRTLIEHGETDPMKFVTTLNRLIYKNVARMRANKNLTFALVQYRDGYVKVVGQHEELLVVRQGGVVECLDTMRLGFPIGIEPDISQWVNAAAITLQPGDGIVLYTDGVTEAENPERRQYGLSRLCEVLSRCWEQSADAIKQAVVQDVLTYIGTQTVYDDITLVVLKHH